MEIPSPEQEKHFEGIVLLGKAFDNKICFMISSDSGKKHIEIKDGQIVNVVNLPSCIEGENGCYGIHRVLMEHFFNKGE